MPLLQRVTSFLASPQGRRVTDQARRQVSDPRRRKQATDFLSRLRTKRR